MAKVNGKTITPRAKVKPTRSPIVADEKYTGTEPIWDTERALTFDEAEFDRHLRRSFFYYNYYYTIRDTRKHLNAWIKTSADYTVEQKKLFERAPDRAIPSTVCNLIMAHRKGMPLLDRHKEYIQEKVLGAIKQAEPEPAAEKPKTEAYRPTIQDRLNEKTAEQIGELEGQYDLAVKNTADFKVYEFLVEQKVPQSQLNKFEDVYRARRAELELAQSKADEQLTEAYSHYRAADYKRIYGFIDSILSAVEQYRGVKKATKKLRVKRPVSKEKLVAKLKYAKDNKELKLVSINPADIPGATTLWCYDTKTRKIIVYHADGLTGPLGVKGTTITGFDISKSIAKTLRKPEDQLKEFMKAGKVDSRKFVDSVKTTATKATGRINANQLLLKVA